MTHSLEPSHIQSDVDDWYFDTRPDIVPTHLSARAVERKVLLGCALVGMIGIVILLAIVAGSSLDIGPVHDLRA